MAVFASLHWNSLMWKWWITVTKFYFFVQFLWNKIHISYFHTLSDALSHKLSICRDLLNHFSKPIVLITCKSFQSSGSWEEIDDIKLSNHKHPLWSFSLHTPVKHATVNKRPLHPPTFHSVNSFHQCGSLTPSFCSCSSADPCCLSCMSTRYVCWPIALVALPPPLPHRGTPCRLLISPSSWFPPLSRSRRALLAWVGWLI